MKRFSKRLSNSMNTFRLRVEQRLGQRWFNLGLRTKMGFLVLIGLVGLFISLFMLGTSAVRQASERVFGERFTLAHLSAASFDRALTEYERMLFAIASDPDFQASGSSAEKRINSLQHYRSFGQGIYYLDNRGIVIDTNAVDPIKVEWGHVQAFRNVRSGSKSAMSLLDNQSSLVAIAVPAQNGSGEVLATVEDLSKIDVFPLVSHNNLGGNATFDLIDQFGQIINSSDPSRVLSKLQNTTALELFFPGGSPSRQTCLGCSGETLTEYTDEVLVFAPLKVAPWGVVIRQSGNEVFFPVRRLTLQILVFSLVTLVGALVLVWITMNSVIHPVQMLSAASQRIIDGDLDTPIDPRTLRNRRDEVGELAGRFNSMRRNLKESIDEIHALNRTLDARVQERTLQAQIAQESLIRRNEQLSILHSVAVTVNQSLDLHEILDRALQEVMRLTSVDMGAIFLRKDHDNELILQNYCGLSREAAELAARFGLLDSACGGVLDTGQIAIVPDITLYKGRRARSLQKENIRALVHVPLTVKGYTLGSLCIGTYIPRQFGDEEQGLLTTIGSEIAVAVENARLYAEVQHKEQVRGELFKKAITAQEEERKRIARDLHDDTSQSLTALLFAMEEGLEMDDHEEMREHLRSMLDLTLHTLDGVHKMVYDLRPSVLDHLGLVPALRSYAESRLVTKGVRLHIEELGEERRLPAEVETALFRVVQEAITNIARHAAPRIVDITFDFNAEGIYIRISDDGIGFVLSEISPSPIQPRGLGLMGMGERVELLGGTLRIDTMPGFGTTLEIIVPVVERSGYLVAG